MAIFHDNNSYISFRNNQSAVAAAAYRSGTKLYQERTGIVNDFTNRKEDVYHTEIFVPEGGPARYYERAVLWNEVEAREKRRDARVARERDIALPHELSLEQNVALARRIAQRMRDDYKVAIDLAIHLPDESKGQDRRNIHMHLLYTTREVGPDGLGEKVHRLDRKATAAQEIEKMRYIWELECNAALLSAGVNARIDRRTLAAQGIDRIPQIHEGPQARALAKEGRKAESVVQVDFKGREINYPEIDQGRSRPEFNAEIIAINERRQALSPVPLDVQIKNIERQIEIHMDNISELERLLPVHILPEFVRERIRIAWQRLQRLLFRRLFEEKARKKRRKNLETMRVQRRLEALKIQLEELEVNRRSLWALKNMHMTIHAALMASARPISNDNPYKMPKIVTTSSFNEQLKITARAMRASVPQEFRPAIKEHCVSSGRKWHNEGTAKPPPKMSGEFNKVSGAQEFKQKVSVSFGPVPS
jgi:hypothetical protein